MGICFLYLRACSRSNDQRSTTVVEKQRDLALIEIDEVLGRFGYDLEHFGLPLPDRSSAPKQTSKELRRELEFNRDEETARAETKRAMMRENPEQAAAYDTIVEHVLSKSTWKDRVALDRARLSIAASCYSVADARESEYRVRRAFISGSVARLALKGDRCESRSVAPSLPPVLICAGNMRENP